MGRIGLISQISLIGMNRIDGFGRTGRMDGSRWVGWREGL